LKLQQVPSVAHMQFFFAWRRACRRVTRCKETPESLHETAFRVRLMGGPWAGPDPATRVDQGIWPPARGELPPRCFCCARIFLPSGLVCASPIARAPVVPPGHCGLRRGGSPSQVLAAGCAPLRRPCLPRALRLLECADAADLRPCGTTTHDYRPSEN